VEEQRHGNEDRHPVSRGLGHPALAGWPAKTVVGGLLLASATGGVAHGASSPLVLSKPGLWTLARMHRVPPTIVPGSRQRVRVTIPSAYALPTGAHEGPRRWYLIHLHYRLQISPRSGSGEIYVSADTDDQTSAQIKYEVIRSDGRLTVTSDSLGLVSGHETRSSHSLVWSEVFENYIVYAGVRPGPNSYAVQVEQYDGARAAKLTVLSDSGIKIEDLAPARLGLQVHVPAQSQVGKQFGVQLTVKNIGGARTPSGQVGVNAAAGFLSWLTPRQRTLPPLRSGASYTATFTALPVRAGRTPVVASARAGLSYPERQVTLRIAGRAVSGTDGGKGWWVAAAVGVALVLVAAFGLTRLRRAA
jgi:hypothetical protein